MAKFSFDWVETVQYNTVIESDTIEDARYKFHSIVDIDGEIRERDFEYVIGIEEIE